MAANRIRLEPEPNDRGATSATPISPTRGTYLDYRETLAKSQRNAHFDSQRMPGSAVASSIRTRPGDIDTLGASDTRGKEAASNEGLPNHRSSGRDNEQIQMQPLPKSNSSQSRPVQRSSRTYDQAEDQLNEVAAPAPARTERAAPASTRDRRRVSGGFDDEDEELNEVNAPRPVQQESRGGQWRRDSHLEDAPAYDDHVQHQKKMGEKSKGPQVSKLVTEFYTVTSLVLFSILGTLARLGMEWLTFYPGAPVTFSVLWANVGGSLVMGFLAEDRKLFQEEWGTNDSKADLKWNPDQDPRGTAEKRSAHLKVKKTIPLYIALTVGFCGSFTSFSTFERDVFLALANKMPSPLSHPADASASPTSSAPRHGGYSFEAVLAVIILTVTACIGALQFGAHAAIALDRLTPVLPFRFVRRIIDPIMAFLGIGFWVGAIAMAAVPPDRFGGPAYQGHPETWRGQVLFALVFAPLGCLLRFYLSLKLNALIPWFPLGTFTANIFGTAVLGMSYDLQRVAILPSVIAGGGRVGCQVLQGVEDGFCGCLTTVSTWMVELTTLRRRHAYLYGLCSVFVGLALLVVIVGSVTWTVGLGEPACVLEVS